MRLKLYQGKWNVVWNDGERTRRKSLGTADRQVAERRFKDVKIEAPDETVSDAVTLYLKDKQDQEASSLESMDFAWLALKPTFGHLRPDQIDEKLCRSYARKRRAQGRKDATVIKELSFLRTALKWAKRPGAEFEFPESPEPRERYLTKPEFERLLNASASPHMRLFTLLALSTAGRATAICELTWDRVYFDRDPPAIQLSKGEGRRKGRATVPMTKRLYDALKAAYELRTSDYVIEYAGEPVRSVKSAFRRQVARAKLKDVSPHVLRHTAAVWMIEGGATLTEVGQFLGHTDLKTTYRVYARFTTAGLKKAAKALE